MFLDFQVSDDHTTILKAHDSAEHIPHHELLHILLTEAHNARTVHVLIEHFILIWNGHDFQLVHPWLDIDKLMDRRTIRCLDRPALFQQLIHTSEFSSRNCTGVSCFLLHFLDEVTIRLILQISQTALSICRLDSALLRHLDDLIDHLHPSFEFLLVTDDHLSFIVRDSTVLLIDDLFRCIHAVDDS